jgi:trafficking protein particle complex subunit 2
MAGNYTFIMVGVKDNPVYEAEFGQMARALPGTAADKVCVCERGRARWSWLTSPSMCARAQQKEDSRHLNQFIVHAAMDIVDEVVWSSKDMYAPQHARWAGPITQRPRPHLPPRTPPVAAQVPQGGRPLQ